MDARRLGRRVNSTRQFAAVKIECTRADLSGTPTPGRPGDQESCSSMASASNLRLSSDGLGAADFLGDQNSGSPSAKSLETCDVSGLKGVKIAFCGEIGSSRAI